MTDSDRWEQGSEFHWPLATTLAPAAQVQWPWGEADGQVPGLLLGSGRDALRLVVAHGRDAHGWRRLWVPSYLCQHVVEVLVGTGLPCVTYVDAPNLPGPEPSTLTPDPDDVVLLVNYVGLRGREVLETVDLGEASLIVDHTHDPWSDWAGDSQADYAVASLRKTLPVPDGGVVWSPRGLPLPAAPALSPTRAAAADAKWKAMRLKGHYLAGEQVAKADFRALATEGEAAMASGRVSGMHPATAARLSEFPIAGWRVRRRRNHQALCEALRDLSGFTVLQSGGDCPFSAFLVFEESAMREQVRLALIEARCYPAILWPMAEPLLDGVPEAHRSLGERSLSIHCDMRYDAEDMARVAQVVADALG